jgi:hypothetical protein
MDDPWNASFEEILQWSIAGQCWPEQDWDLAVINVLSLSNFENLIAHPSISKSAKQFFIGCLYILVGDAVRTSDSIMISQVKAFIETSLLSKSVLAKWAERAVSLIEKPDLYSYAYWGCLPLKFAEEDGL